MPHSRNRPQHHQGAHQPPHVTGKRKRRKESAAIIFAVFVGLIGAVIGYLTVGTEWQLYAIIIFSALVGFFIGRKVDESVAKRNK